MYFYNMRCISLGTFTRLRKATTSFVMFVCLSAWNNWAHTELIFVKFEYFSKIYGENSNSMRFACWITKATDTLRICNTLLLSQDVILIAVPLQQWLRERVSKLSYAYVACLVSTHFFFIYTVNVV
jgi:hypothetical protein